MGAAKFMALVVQYYSLRKINVGGPQEVQLPLRSELEAGGRHNEVHTILTRRFEADLAVRLQQLQLPGDGAGSAHLNWLLDASASTLSTHASLTPLLLRLSPPPASSSTHGRRADQLPSLLDLCASLKHMADDVDRQLTLLQRALHTAEQALHMPPQGRSASPAAPLIPQSAAAVRRLRACLPGLQLLNTKQYKPLAEAHAALLLAAKQLLLQVATPTSADPLNHALDGTLLISLLLLSSTLSSFAAPTRRSSGATRSACKIIARYCSKIRRRNSSTTTTTSTKGARLDIQPEWLAPFQQLQRDLKQQQMSCVFLELQRLQASASSLLISIAAPEDDTCISKLVAEQLRQNVDSLRKSSQEAQACISALRSHLASLFQALLSLRLALMIPCS